MRKISIILLLAGGVLSGVVIGILLALTHDLPSIRALETFHPPAVTRIFSADHVLLAEIYSQKREPVTLDKIPKALKDALLVTEDRNFYHHSGIDIKGIFRAAVKDVLAGHFVEGASTLTQQLAKTLFLTPKKSLLRKAREAFLAVQLERRYTKDEILALYLNQIYLGSGTYGVQTAAKRYFGKPVSALDLAQCALIAGLPKAPSRYSPLANPQLAVSRRNLVLRQMKDAGLISSRDYARARQQPLRLAPRKSGALKAPYFVDTVKSILEKQIGAARLYRGGLRVVTSLSYKLQQAARQALDTGLAALEARMRKAGIGQPPPQGALLALDVKSGGILAMVGGRDWAQSSFNRATQALRQPGSAFKPIVYACAIERGYAQNRLLLDAPIVFKGAGGKDWQPENFSHRYHGEMTLRRALVLSENIPAVRLMEALGPASVAALAHKLGITTPLTADLSLALGTSEVKLIDLTAAYAAFANGGLAIRPQAVLEVSDADGDVLWRPKPVVTAALSRAGAAIICNMLQAVIQEGTGKKARILQRPVAGKTGTTSNFRDALFVGFSPSIAAGVWIGRDNAQTLGRGETGSRAALPVWIAFMRQALADRLYEDFDMPDDAVQVYMDPATGQALPPSARRAVKALFKRGTAPAPR